MCNCALLFSACRSCQYSMTLCHVKTCCNNRGKKTTTQRGVLSCAILALQCVAVVGTRLTRTLQHNLVHVVRLSHSFPQYPTAICYYFSPQQIPQLDIIVPTWPSLCVGLVIAVEGKQGAEWYRNVVRVPVPGDTIFHQNAFQPIKMWDWNYLCCYLQNHWGKNVCGAFDEWPLPNQ